ncbi:MULTISPECIES: hypothetical protein [Clostridium]|uniref:hypothetical protein n=1 Tax=Clostridium TaxID=1485 RepID=UPI00257A60DC|nr:MULTISPECIES: hypothetical protein [Clostridium]WRY50932.1 hypothetical protein P8F83_20140 [Clostridium intestinale]
MLEAIEQQIINSINNKWTKDKDKRRDIDIDKVSENFRIICSSRATTINIIESLKISENKESKIQELKENMSKIYNWITEESINSLIVKYNTSLKDKKKEAEYKAELLQIQDYLEELQKTIINRTVDKLFLFHKIIGGE